MRKHPLLTFFLFFKAVQAVQLKILNPYRKDFIHSVSSVTSVVNPNSKPNKTMSKSQFVTKAPEITPIISGQSIAATPRKFSTGSVGYNLNGKVTLSDGTGLQVTGNAIVIGSKGWSE